LFHDMFLICKTVQLFSGSCPKYHFRGVDIGSNKL